MPAELTDEEFAELEAQARMDHVTQAEQNDDNAAVRRPMAGAAEPFGL